MPKAPDAPAADLYAGLSDDAKRSALDAHRAALVSDRYAAELFLERTVPDSDGHKAGEDRLAQLDAALAATAERLAAIPPAS